MTTHQDDRLLTEALNEARDAGRVCALATVVGTRGSTPRKVGARLLVDPQRGLTGTVGGGCGEAEVIEAAHRVLDTGQPVRVTVDLTEDFTTWSPAVCGGTMDVYVERVGPVLAARGGNAVARAQGAREDQTRRDDKS